MMTSTYQSRSTHGFTLVELVVAIVISSIVAFFIGIFITTPVDNYFAQSRRAELIGESDLIQRNMDHDIRNAVPNSIRAKNTGTVKILELLYVVDMARYLESNPGGVANNELDVTTADQQFSTLGIFNKVTLPCCAAGSGYRFVINQNQVAGQDAYKGNKSITPFATTITITNDIVNRIGNVTLSSAFKFASDSPTHHVFLIRWPVAYVCDQNAHTLKRYENYPISNGIAANRNATTNAIGTISQDINTCDFQYTSSTSSRTDLVSATIQLLRSGETMPVFIQSAVDNMP